METIRKNFKLGLVPILLAFLITTIVPGFKTEARAGSGAAFLGGTASCISHRRCAVGRCLTFSGAKMTAQIYQFKLPDPEPEQVVNDEVEFDGGDGDGPAEVHIHFEIICGPDDDADDTFDEEIYEPEPKNRSGVLGFLAGLLLGSAL